MPSGAGDRFKTKFVVDGGEPRLAGGPSGLYLLDLEHSAISSSGGFADAVHKFTPSEYQFGPWVLLSHDSVAETSGGAIAQSPKGEVVVVAPSPGPNRAMRLWVDPTGALAPTGRDGASSFGGPVTTSLRWPEPA